MSEANGAPTDAPSPVLPPLPGGPRRLTARERRRRLLLLTVLLLALAVLSYTAYYFTQNRRLPTVRLAPMRRAVQPPTFLYAISATGANQLSRPVGVGVAADGRVYVVDFGHRRISVFSNDGHFLFSFHTTKDGNIVNPVHLAVRGNEVWVSDRRRRQLYVFDLEGKYLRTFTPKDEKLVWTPLAFAFDPDGSLRVTDVAESDKHRVHFFSAEGSRTATIGRTEQVNTLEQSPGAFLFPDGVAVAPNHSVYISDGDNRRVQVFAADGTFKSFVNTSGVPRGIAVDQKQRLYVVDALAHTVDVYDLAGRLIVAFGSHGFGPGQFNYPNDVTIDKNGRIYVSDRDNDQIQVWGWPVAEPPAVRLPQKPADFAWCLTPLLLLPLLLLRRRTRFIVTPEFVEALAASGDLTAVMSSKRLRFVAPLADEALYAGRSFGDVPLSEIVMFEEHSEPDVRAMIDKLHVGEREAILLSMAQRAKALGTEDLQLRWLSTVAEVRPVDAAEFRETYLRQAK